MMWMVRLRSDTFSRRGGPVRETRVPSRTAKRTSNERRVIMRGTSSSLWPIALLLAAICLTPSAVNGQAGESDLKIFGYLQGSFYLQDNAQNAQSLNTFTTQQLNIFLRKDLARRWSAWVNLAFTNNYSSFRNWGTFGLEEAWVKFRKDRYLSLKMGLLIPKFNYLNEVKNRMPLLPYIVRPLVYETSFQQDVPLDDFVPQQAFVQVYGSARTNKIEFDYAAYVGNSPNINTDSDIGNTGLDTTRTLLVGGRVGIDYAGLKIGFSATHDKTGTLNGLSPDSLTHAEASLHGETPRYRLGGDLSYGYKDISLWAEFILVTYDEGIPDMNVDQEFWYATLGYLIRERLFVYGTYWLTDMNLARFEEGTGWESGDFRIKIPGAGAAYYMYDRRITLKAAVAWVDMDIEYVGARPSPGFNHYSLAISVMF